MSLKIYLYVGIFLIRRTFYKKWNESSRCRCEPVGALPVYLLLLILVQVLSDHKRNLKTPSVWEQICAVQREATFTDVNSNFSYEFERPCYHKTASCLLSQTRPLAERENSYYWNHQSTTQAERSAEFETLPLDCKLKIFSYLNHTELGKCMLVSPEWYQLARTPQLWKSINLREFVLCQGHDTSRPDGVLTTENDPDPCTLDCYHRYMVRMDRFISFLIDIQPQVKVKRIAISFDLATDSWMEKMKRLFRHVNFTQLRYADIDWHVTPVKPMWLVAGSPSFQLKDIAYATRRRERLFLEFLEEFVPEMPNLESLIVPFSWTQRAMKYLTLLPSLSALVLKKYTVFCAPDQKVFDELANMKRLEKLLLEVWMSTTNPPHRYSISSATLKYLSLSQCRGFYLQHVDLPALEVLKIERNNAICQDQATLPCLYDLFIQGAPNLKKINNAIVTSMSRDGLEHLFSSVCPCKRHQLV